MHVFVSTLEALRVETLADPQANCLEQLLRDLSTYLPARRRRRRRRRRLASEESSASTLPSSSSIAAMPARRRRRRWRRRLPSEESSASTLPSSSSSSISSSIAAIPARRRRRRRRRRLPSEESSTSTLPEEISTPPALSSLAASSCFTSGETSSPCGLSFSACLTTRIPATGQAAHMRKNSAVNGAIFIQDGFANCCDLLKC